MRMKKDKDKPGQVPSQRHSAAASYEISAQSAMLHDHSDEYVLELFEQMLVRPCVCLKMNTFTYIDKCDNYHFLSARNISSSVLCPSKI